jgi:hypothetical protein
MEDAPLHFGSASPNLTGAHLSAFAPEGLRRGKRQAARATADNKKPLQWGTRFTLDSAAVNFAGTT